MRKSVLACAVALSLSASTFAAENGIRFKEVKKMKSHNSNPWGLVYAGAIEKNEAGKVNIRSVRYHLNGIEIAANVYTPAGYDAKSDKKYPAIVVAHPNGGVKEQVAGLFAQRLAEAGYITVAADASYQGASGGFPRHTDKPAFRINDIHGMVDFISNFPGVDSSRIGALGICGGGGYTLGAAQSDKRIKAVATLSMFNSGRVRRNGFQDSQIATIQERLKEASEARAAEGTRRGCAAHGRRHGEHDGRGCPKAAVPALPRRGLLLFPHARPSQLHIPLHHIKPPRLDELGRDRQNGLDRPAAFDGLWKFRRHALSHRRGISKGHRNE